jgi:hypothetical protein
LDPYLRREDHTGVEHFGHCPHYPHSRVTAQGGESPDLSSFRARLFGFVVAGAEESDLPSFAVAVDDYTHALAEQIRSTYGQPRWPEEEPEYAYGYNAGIHDGADLIDPRATLAADGKEASA